MKDLVLFLARVLSLAFCGVCPFFARLRSRLLLSESVCGSYFGAAWSVLVALLRWAVCPSVWPVSRWIAGFTDSLFFHRCAALLPTLIEHRAAEWGRRAVVVVHSSKRGAVDVSPSSLLLVVFALAGGPGVATIAGVFGGALSCGHAAIGHWAAVFVPARHSGRVSAVGVDSMLQGKTARSAALGRCLVAIALATWFCSGCGCWFPVIRRCGWLTRSGTWRTCGAQTTVVTVKTPLDEWFGLPMHFYRQSRRAQRSRAADFGCSAVGFSGVDRTDHGRCQRGMPSPGPGLPHWCCNCYPPAWTEPFCPDLERLDHRFASFRSRGAARGDGGPEQSLRCPMACLPARRSGGDQTCSRVRSNTMPGHLSMVWFRTPVVFGQVGNVVSIDVDREVRGGLLRNSSSFFVSLRTQRAAPYSTVRGGFDAVFIAAAQSWLLKLEYTQRLPRCNHCCAADGKSCTAPSSARWRVLFELLALWADWAAHAAEAFRREVGNAKRTWAALCRSWCRRFDGAICECRWRRRDRLFDTDRSCASEDGRILIWTSLPMRWWRTFQPAAVEPFEQMRRNAMRSRCWWWVHVGWILNTTRKGFIHGSRGAGGGAWACIQKPS